ncbi:MAG TPA: OmpA family protein [Candidatus Babeliales bacterium]|nr:OmpA family protein [Candidatus Babeliales bacterium]
MQKKILLFVTLFIIALSGCGKKKVKREHPANLAAAVDMPVPSKGGQPKVSFFDEDLGAFEDVETLVLDEENAQKVEKSDVLALDEPDQSDEDVLVVYFDYDSAKVRDDQKAKLASVKKQVDEWVDEGKKVVVKGHSCTWHGTKDYNLALSNQRASDLAQTLVGDSAKGNIKVFGVGNEELAAFENTFEGQAPNRRVEIYAINA